MLAVPSNLLDDLGRALSRWRADAGRSPEILKPFSSGSVGCVLTVSWACEEPVNNPEYVELDGVHSIPYIFPRVPEGLSLRRCSGGAPRRSGILQGSLDPVAVGF
ncbi:MAG: hypothetical protein CMO66_01155 [Verrucomicrobiales bacterium]|nr:hypothetical protein [Verrucomicrobiales bacterium]